MKETSTALEKGAGGYPFRGRCHQCGELGHRVAECPLRWGGKRKGQGPEGKVKELVGHAEILDVDRGAALREKVPARRVTERLPTRQTRTPLGKEMAGRELAGKGKVKVGKVSGPIWDEDEEDNNEK